MTESGNDDLTFSGCHWVLPSFQVHLREVNVTRRLKNTRLEDQISHQAEREATGATEKIHGQKTFTPLHRELTGN